MIIEKILNIGIFAHVDAGKTTLTENLLYKTGVINKIGRVDNGDATTDQMDLERKRGISISASPISFDYKGIKVNLIDTPGHVDFVAEVERAMGVLDGAVLVVSAREGVQSHTNLLYKSLKKLSIPTIIFVNKIDRFGVNIKDVISQIEELLTYKNVKVQSVNLEGNKVDVSEMFDVDFDECLEKLTYSDDDLLERVLNDESISKEDIIDSVIKQTSDLSIHPVMFGSALHGIGMSQLLEGIINFLPKVDYKPNGELAGVVFKIKRNIHDKREIFIRLYEGTIKARQWLGDEKVSFVKKLRNGKMNCCPEAYGNDIVVIQGVDSLKVGDVIGSPKEYHPISLGEPALRTRISANDKKKLAEVINRVAEADPFLKFEMEPHSGDLYLNLFGGIQMEILKVILLESYNIDVFFSDPFIIYKEMPIGTGEYTLRMYTKEHPFYATVGIRVEPSEKSFEFNTEVTTGFLPKTFQNGIKDGIKNYLKEGLHGWEITNLKVTLIEGAFDSVNSTPSDFRDLTPMVFMEALNISKTKLLWPINKFEIKVSNSCYGKVISDLMQMKAVDVESTQCGGYFQIHGNLPIENSIHYKKKFIEETSGHGIYMTSFNGYVEAPNGVEKTRDNKHISPLDRGKYLLSKLRTV